MSTSSIEQQIRDAKQHRFENSTTEDLLEFCGHLKIPVGDNDSQDVLRGKVRQFLGMADVTGAMKRAGNSKAVAKNQIRPCDSSGKPINLSPNGLWGGRRHLVKLSPPPGSKLAKAEPIGWNGKATYWLPYNEVHSVPEPVYNILADRRQKVVVNKRTVMDDGTVEITTQWQFNSMQLEYKGIDPKTANLPGSITEFYQALAPSWFKKLGLRDLQTVCNLNEVPLKMKNGLVEQSKTDTELLSDLFICLFGYADVEDAAEASA